jgi:hypothetical protein
MIIWEVFLLAKKPPIFTSVTVCSTGGIWLSVRGSVLSLDLLQVSLSPIMTQLRGIKAVQRTGRRAKSIFGAIGLFSPMKHPAYLCYPAKPYNMR